ncbi:MULTISPECIES: hypothetical protein [unclassified Anabaena]|uniref:hypothetical protein n=1 Tax=unclassified Anabaena TaxID=2619674 RepID=UPI001686539D|nr:hypothetical protein [Anabaena sp. UHCC 0399]MBD2363059.1 hypothetical protein [Anabaena minutissima FACHB-250]MEA5568678.1 hypothetical protein [Anabaena sp. UHCC 0399]
MKEVKEERQTSYFNLIDELLQCPNGQEPEILEANKELIDANFVETIVQVATTFAHQGNQDGSKFLFFLARELAKYLGLYPDFQQPENTNTEAANKE